ncbi:AraC family transcriptional regulator [Pseudomonas eucalypticola]|uniref:AraC family transcriptional regulator n=1 Tax=Pseudomonas eucalypticola TaxID=2599595 RepID=A0A7D5D7M8_9PSED|nr:AraC family transcriptional regulator [Pseudomonas eucalypticola]QKZ04833.1 AraC family transcriptional regulator [Pseudomonas eucalypticola]
MHTPLLGQRSEIFNQADPHAVSLYVNQHVGSHCIELPRTSHPRAQLRHRTFAELDLCRITYGAPVRVVSPALELCFHVQVLLQGHCLWRHGRQEHDLAPGELLMINPDDPVDLTYSADCEKFIVKVPVRLLAGLCTQQRWNVPASGVRFVQQRYRLDDVQGLVNLLGLVCQEAEEPEAQPLVQAHYTQIVASKLLRLLKNNVRRDDEHTLPANVERVLEYIDRHLQEPLDTNVLARLAQVSPRTLYGLFARHACTSPVDYVRQRRLARVHACLADPTCTVRSVSQLALDYGFMHLGRFAEQYRQRFGQLPSETLGQRRASVAKNG